MPEGTNTDIVVPTKPAIYAAAMSVMEQVTDIGKNRRMPKEAHVGEYAYRSNEDVQDEISKAFRDFGIITQSRDLHLEREQTKVSGQRGDTWWTSVWVTVTYRFTSLEDGSCLEFAVAGEGRDNSDKATNKAMTAAHKTAVTQLFEIAYGALDPDSERPMITQDAQYRPAPPPQQDNRTPAQREAEEAWKARQAQRQAPQGQPDAEYQGYRASEAAARQATVDEYRREFPANQSTQRPAVTPEQREARRQTELPNQAARQQQGTAQTRPAPADPLGEAERTLAQEMGAAPVDGPDTPDRQATRALAMAAKARVQAEMNGGDVGVRSQQQAEQARKAILAGRAAADRDQMNRIVLYAHDQGLLPLSVDGMTVCGELAAVRGTLVSS